MNKLILLLTVIALFSSCKRKDLVERETKQSKPLFLSAVDISSLPEISNQNLVFYHQDGKADDFLALLKKNGVNTVRLRLWVNPANQHSGFEEVKHFAKNLKTKGFNIWLSLHYSDTWADPAQQKIPKKWEGISFSKLKDSVYQHTQKVMKEINPEYIQIGNEINGGLLLPAGDITQNNAQFIELISAGIAAVRANSKNTQIMIHFAGIDGSDWFFNQVKNLDYDIIGLSYYPIWHGKSLSNLKTKMQLLVQTHNKKIVIAETAYPFTLEWNDWTNNIVGLNSQLILPQFPATPKGQQDFVHQIKQLTKEVKNGIGFCYWGAELVSWKGNQATNASPWENQALFDFKNKALPVITEFKVD